MDRYGASAREYSRNDDFDTHHPRRTGGTSGRGDSTRERALFHSGRGSTANPFATSEDDNEESEYGGHRQHHRGVASGGYGRTRRHHRRDEDPVIEQLRREVREDEARQLGARFGGGYYSDDDDDFQLSHRTSTVAPRGVTRAGGVGTGNGNGNGNGGTHRRRRRREDPVIEQLRREVREDEARFSGSRGHYSDDSEGETEFGRRLEREVRAGRRGNGVRTPPRGHVDDSEDDGMDRGRRRAFCGGRPC